MKMNGEGKNKSNTVLKPNFLKFSQIIVDISVTLLQISKKSVVSGQPDRKGVPER